jgi:hypothetical protein
LNGKKPEEDKPEADYGKKKDTRPCLCGEIHRFSQCLYFIPSLRPANWTEDLEIRKKIDATLRDKPSLRNAIKVARQGVKNAEKKKNSGEGNGSHTSTSATDHSTPSENFSAKHVTFNTHRFTGFTQSDYALRKSFIADNAADTHVINHHYRNRLVNFRPGIPGDSLLHGNSSSQVAGYGDATVYTKDENGMQVKLTIKDVIYVPDFHTNIVSLSRAKAANIGFNTLTGILAHCDGEIFAVSEFIHNMWVLEYHPVKESNRENASFRVKRNTQPKSSAPLTSAAPFEVWRTRLGYPSEEATHRLPASAEGVELTDKPTSDIPKPLNESYEVANPKHQISRRHPHQPPTRPFEILWADLVYETIPGYDGSRWVLHYYCPFLKLHIVERLRRKGDISDSIPAMVAYIKRQFKFETKEIHMDVEQSLNSAFHAWIERTGIRLVFMAEYTEEPRGAIERAGRTLGEKQRFLRIDARLPENIWPETWTTSAYLANRTPNRSLGWKSPWQVLNEWLKRSPTKPLIGHLRRYGSRMARARTSWIIKCLKVGNQ